MSAHLGADLPALIDGELGHAARERVLRHLAHCAACRSEMDEQRRLKARLLGLAAPPPPDALTDRLLALPVDPVTTPPGVRRGGAPERRAAVRTPTGGPRPPTAHRARRVSVGPGRGVVRRVRRVPRRALGGAAVALGLGAVLALGSPPAGAGRPPVDPTSDAFLLEHASTLGELPLADPAGVTYAGFTR